MSDRVMSDEWEVASWLSVFYSIQKLLLEIFAWCILSVGLCLRHVYGLNLQAYSARDLTAKA